MDSGPVRKVRFASTGSTGVLPRQATKTMLCERTKTKITTVNVSPSNTDCNEKDEAVTSDAGLYKEAWPLIVSRLGYNTGSLS
jgi:hypothetical protein